MHNYVYRKFIYHFSFFWIFLIFPFKWNSSTLSYPEKFSKYLRQVEQCFQSIIPYSISAIKIWFVIEIIIIIFKSFKPFLTISKHDILFINLLVHKSISSLFSAFQLKWQMTKGNLISFHFHCFVRNYLLNNNFYQVNI